MNNNLTPQERSILTCALRDMSHLQTAEALGISTRTVDKHRENIRKKTRAHSMIRACVVVLHAEGLLSHLP